MIKRLLLVLLALALVFGAVFGFKYWQMQKQMAARGATQPAVVATAVARRDRWQPALEAVGSIIPTRGVIVPAEVSGVVQSINFDSGQHVDAGELLVELDTEVDVAEQAVGERPRRRQPLQYRPRHRHGVGDSLGIGDNTDFDLALIERCGAEVHAFDPTPGTYDTLETTELPPKLVFHPWAVAGANGTFTLYPRVRHSGRVSETMYTLVADKHSVRDAIEVPAYTIASIIEQLRHEQVDLVKMDIEGAEYEAIESLLQSGHRPTQLLVEFHHRHTGIGKRRTEAAVDALLSAGYRIFSVSDNVREVSFMYSGPATSA